MKRVYKNPATVKNSNQLRGRNRRASNPRGQQQRQLIEQIERRQERTGQYIREFRHDVHDETYTF